MKIKILTALCFILSFSFLLAQSTSDDYRLVKPIDKTIVFSGDHQYETVSNLLLEGNVPKKVNSKFQILNPKS